MATTTPLFSVVIPTFNRGAHVATAIHSVLRQNCRDFELIVVDDGSTDNTSELLGQFANVLRTVRQPNAGASRARNRGAEAATGSWLAFLDSDDQWEPEHLEVHRRQLEFGSEVVFQCSDCAIQGAAPNLQYYFVLNGAGQALRRLASGEIDRPFSFVIEHSPWQVGATVVRLNSFRTAGGFDERLSISEDLEFLARLSTLGRARFLPMVTMRVNRVDEVGESLSVAADRRPAQKREVHESIFGKLANLPGLTASERQTVLAARSANMRALGNVRRHEGDHAAARLAYRQAFLIAPSLRSFGKLCASSLPTLRTPNR